MKILHLTSHLHIGGVTSSVLTLCRGLCQRGHEVTIASDGGPLAGRASEGGLTHWALPLHTSVEFSPQVWRATRRLASRLRPGTFDIMHAHTRVSQVVADRLSRRTRIPYVTTWHGFFRPNLGRRLWPCTGEAVIAISDPVRQHLLHTFHVSVERVRLIPHGIDPAPFESPIEASAQHALREQCRLAGDGPIVGTIARLVASKGIDQLIRSLPSIRRFVPTAQLLIVGEGEERPRLERLADSLGLSAAVRFAGALPQTSVALSLMNVFVFLPAEQEGFGLSLLEAMASGRPIVAVRRGLGASWVLEQSGVGELVEPGDPEALAAGILPLLRDREAACRAAGRAQAVVRERYAVSTMVERVEAVYQDVMTPRRHKSSDEVMT